MFVPLLGAVVAPLAADALAAALAAVCLLPFARFGLRGHLRLALILATTMLALPSVLIAVANQHGVSGWVPLLYAFLPLLTGLEAWSPAMLIAVGATLVILGGSVPFALAKLPWAAMVLAGVGVQAFALRYAGDRLKTLTVKQLLGSVGCQCAVACTLLASASLLLEPAPRLATLAQWNLDAALGLAYEAIAGVAACYAALYLLLARAKFTPQQVATTQWLQLLLGLGEASAFARTRPSAQVVTAAVVLAGCAAAVLRAAPGSNRGDTPNILPR